MRFDGFFGFCVVAAAPAFSCDSCYGPSHGAHVRNVRRMQPGTQNAVDGPKGPLAWGELNVLHTTDTHGWLEGHIKEQNYGADWGDFVSFTKHMRQKADQLNVDLLLVDTGDLHDGAGLSDATTPDGVLSNPIFENVDFDLLTIGNHELYLSDIAYLTATQFVKYYGKKYISSNVQIYNNATSQYENIANQYRYFTTKKGLKIMAFGVLYDFTGNSNASRVITATNMIQEQWFKDAVNFKKPIDLFLLVGHNPVRNSGGTIGTVYQAIRSARPDIPIQVFGGHTHVRDFIVYDGGSTGLESGRYCETLGFLSMSGIKSKTYYGSKKPRGVPNPTQPAQKVNGTSNSTSTDTPAFSNLRYFRRYLDWNRLTFAYHAPGSQSATFDTSNGKKVSAEITALREQLNLTALYGCAPQTWCLSCKPANDPGNINSLAMTALAATVVNESRANTPRIILINQGSIRFDLVEGPFTYDDSFIVSPFHDTFQYIPDVPYSQAKKVLGILNAGAFQKRSNNYQHVSRDLETQDFEFSSAFTSDICVDAATSTHDHSMLRRSEPMTRGKYKRQTSKITPGYATKDDFGTDGDDTIHSKIPFYYQPNDIQANASFPTDGSDPETVDVIFLDYIGPKYVVPALNKAGGKTYSASDILQYLPPSFDTNAYLPAYAKKAWQKNVPNCPVGQGVGFQ